MTRKALWNMHLRQSTNWRGRTSALYVHFAPVVVVPPLGEPLLAQRAHGKQGENPVCPRPALHSRAPAVFFWPHNRPGATRLGRRPTARKSGPI